MRLNHPTAPGISHFRDSFAVSRQARGGHGTLCKVDLDVLRRSPLFAGLDEQAVKDLLATMTPVQMDRGDVLFHEHDPGDRLYVIADGKVKLGRTSPDGRENLLAILGPGEMFGELSLFDPGPRTGTATAIAETQLVGLGSEALRSFLADRPQAALTLLAALARRLRRTNESLADLVFTDVPGRVAKALLDLSQRFGRPVEEGTLVAHDLTQEELAQLVGASRETVNKALADFVTRGWIRLEARAVLLLNLERLQKRAGA